MPFYGPHQAAALYAKYPPRKAKRIIRQLQEHDSTMPATKNRRRPRSSMTALSGERRNMVYDQAVSKANEMRAELESGNSRRQVQQDEGRGKGRRNVAAGVGHAVRQVVGGGKPGPGEKGFGDRPKRFQTTRGLHRMSFRQAYSRRTTDSSRARVMKLYGRGAPPKGFGGDRGFGTPISNDTAGRIKQVAGQRVNGAGGTVAPSRKRRRYGPRTAAGGSGPLNRNV